jgi:hypothetical protein
MEGSVLSFLKAEWKVSDTEPLVLLATVLSPPYSIYRHFLNIWVQLCIILSQCPDQKASISNIIHIKMIIIQF